MKRSYAELEAIVDNLVGEEPTEHSTTIEADGDNAQALVTTSTEVADVESESGLATSISNGFSIVDPSLVDESVTELLQKAIEGETNSRKTSIRRLVSIAPSLDADRIITTLILKITESHHSINAGATGATESGNALERHRLLKATIRVISKLPSQSLVPWTYQLLRVAQPFLTSNDRLCNQEATDLVSTVAETVGLRAVIIALRSDLESDDDSVRVRVSATVAAVTPSLGISTLLPFLEAVCNDKRTRITGLATISRLSHQCGCAILPYLDRLVACTLTGLAAGGTGSRNAAYAISRLAEAVSPFGIEAFEPTAPYLWTGIRQVRGRGLAAYLRALGSLIPLMDPESAREYAPAVLKYARRELETTDDDLRRAVIIVFQQCLPGIDPQELREVVGPEFLSAMYTRRVALDTKFSGMVVRTCVLLVDHADDKSLVVEFMVARGLLKDPSQPLQSLCLDTIARVLTETCILNDRTERLLVDGVLACLHLGAPGVIDALCALAISVPNFQIKYIDDVAAELKGKLANPSPEDREMGAQAIAAIASHHTYIADSTLWLYEQLGEEYPNVLASIISAIRAIIDQNLSRQDLNNLNPPITDILPRLTPILRNRNERVQEVCTALIGSIAENGGCDFIPAREWMRICFELLELFKSPRLSVRRVANEAFGSIASGIGPSDVLLALLNNLRSPDRQSRVCTAVAIGITAKRCEPFTVLPALLNEYRSPDQNVQQGVLKALSFVFEFIGPDSTAQHYIPPTITLLDDALTLRSQVYRQTAATVVQHMALGCASHGVEEFFVHVLNEIMPSVFESSPHVIERVLDSIDAIRNALGAAVTMNYIWGGLFHPARKVRTIYWQIYNNAYIQSADALVPAYPIVDREELQSLDVWF